MKRSLLLCLMVGVLALGPSVLADDSRDPQARGPILKLLSPIEHSFVHGGEASVVIVLEITDVGGAGLLADDTGIPTFIAANRNVGRFTDHIVLHGTYTDGFGRKITQLIADIPTARLEIGDVRLTPIVDWTSVPEDLKEVGFMFTGPYLLDAADFEFQVKDRKGEKSEIEKLYVAFYTEKFRGPFTPPSARILAEHGEKPRPEPEQGLEE